MNEAVGAKHGVGVGLADAGAELDADADGPAVVDGLGVGDGVGLAEGLGLGLGEGAAFGAGGTVICASAFAVSVRSLPINGQRNGVMVLKWPVTTTTARFPSIREQDGVHDIDTSAGAMVMNDPADSLIARHITRFVTLSHG